MSAIGHKSSCSCSGCIFNCITVSNIQGWFAVMHLTQPTANEYDEESDTRGAAADIE